ncbi:serine/threonine-protein kinase pkn1 [bacterium MnTg02]|nr:serine/threonine-protein kinase pkn1 [bacterium MnTg02]
MDGSPYRLLSEAEWEYVARAQTQTPYFFGNNQNALCANGNGADKNTSFSWKNKSCSDGYMRTAPVGTFSKNGFGLYDVHGNFWEWVADCWHENYISAPVDGSAWLDTNSGDCAKRGLRGGSWFIDPGFLRSANRGREISDLRYNFNGFRISRTLN